jgi:hypothetical protein
MTFQNLDLFPSSDEGGENMYSVGSLRKSQPQSLENPCQIHTCDLQFNGYSQGFIDLVINSRCSSHLNKEQKPMGSVYIPYVKGVSEKFKCIGDQYNIRTIFKTKHTLRSSLMKTMLERDTQKMAQCVYSNPCECGRSYIGETGRHLAMWLC